MDSSPDVSLEVDFEEQKKLNLMIWNQVKDSDPRSLKKVTYGARSFLAIDAYPQIKKATQVFGPMGYGFGLDDIKYSIVEEVNKKTKEGIVKVKILVCNARFWYLYPGSSHRFSFPLMSDIEVSAGGDFGKKVLTDMLTKGLSYLGFNYDVFKGKFDDNKYVDRLDIPAPNWMIDNFNTLIQNPVIPEDKREKGLKFQIDTGWTEKSVVSAIAAMTKMIKDAGGTIPELKSDPTED